jgi:hypothetical protein
MPTSPTPITALPTPPSRDDSVNFSSRADAFVGALPTFGTQANSLATNVYNNAVEADADAVAADASAVAAAASAAAAATTANVVLWVSGSTYAAGTAVYSPIDFLTYRRTSASPGSSTTDPSADTTRWVQISISANVANTFTAAQTFPSAGVKINGATSGTVTFTVPAVAGTPTITFPAETMTVGFRNIPQSGSDKTTSYSLATSDVGKFVGVGASGSITVPNSTFAAGDVISIFNNTSGNVTLTMSITTAYIAGTNTDKDTMTLATRGVATILFISGTVCVVSGNVS